MNIYAISGLGADKRVFDFLDLDGEFICIDWLDPLKGESIEEYSVRLVNGIDTSENFVLIGVSFGGLVATEISKVLKPKLCILISSVEVRSELPRVARLMGKLRFTRLLPTSFFNPPKKLVQWLFQTNHKRLLNQILQDTDAKFAKWALNEIFNWKNETRLKNVLKISGANERVLPISKDSNTILVENGQHFMIVDKADEISRIINQHLKKL